MTSSSMTLHGTVSYRERELLPPTAEIVITVADVARADARADILATARFTPTGGPPFAFAVEYDPSRLDERGRYAVRATIEVDGRLLFTSTEHIPAFDRPTDDPIEIMLTRVGDRPTAPEPDWSFTDTYWKLTELEGRPASHDAGERELHVVFESETKRVRGFSGCNTFAGGYVFDERRVLIGPLASTRRICRDGMEQEHQFLSVLHVVRRVAISGSCLVMFDSDERLVLRFVAVALA